MTAAPPRDTAPPTISRARRASAAALAHPVRTLLVGYAVSRVVVLLALWVAATWFQNPAGVAHLHPTIGDLFGLWDGTWYDRIVHSGYPVPLPVDPTTGRLTYSAWAFYPGFPYLVKPFVALGVPFVVAGTVVNALLGALATVLVWAVLRFGLHAEPQAARERLALVGALLWTLHPATTVLLQPYSEGLAVVLVALCLLLLMQRRYVAVSGVAVLLGLTRAVAPAIGLVVLVHLVVRWREDRAAGRRPLGGQRATVVVMLVVTAVSGLLWPAIAGWSSGIPTAFFQVQAAWGQKPTEGPFVLWLDWAWGTRGAFSVAVLLGCVATYLALVLGRHGRWLPIEIRAWAVAYPLYIVAVVRPITSMWRFLLLDFPVAALVASVALRTSTGAQVVPHWRRRVAVIAVVLAVGVVWWTCAVWVYTPWGSRPP
ncbi:Integral membrane protein [Nostocoides japonicum T1-X7]|uniref:Integral membrane protein n=1 Tax=Nostocoides japonicum T1-X7 TaxID=1194083 RepID=A0A077LTJ4_9MICO|nr:hypothetical protein [Tetrasphaera japonica]CCH76561.1 Integral membrane protein [Tetrasphaera japonica T1-X7]